MASAEKFDIIMDIAGTASLFCDHFQEEIFPVLIAEQKANNATLHAFE